MTDYLRITAQQMVKGMLISENGLTMVVTTVFSDTADLDPVERCYWTSAEIIDTIEAIKDNGVVPLSWCYDHGTDRPRWTLQGNSRRDLLALVYGPARMTLDEFCQSRAQTMWVDWDELNDDQRAAWREDLTEAFLNH